MRGDLCNMKSDAIERDFAFITQHKIDQRMWSLSFVDVKF